jgi:hypothetical protein
VNTEGKILWEKLYKTRQYIVGSMTILQIDGRDVETGSTKIYAEELSVEKIRFVCRVQIPENKDILLGLRFTIANKPLDFKAAIQAVHANEKKKRYTYLVEFKKESDNDTQDVLTFVNKVQLANKQKKLRSITETAVDVE